MLEHQLAVGRTYRFTFKPEFERHGVCSSGAISCIHPGNGTFTLQQISTYGDIVAAGINLFKNFFEPIGLTEDEYRAYFSGRPANEYTPEYKSRKITTVTPETIIVSKPTENGGTTSTQIVRNNVKVSHQIVETGNSILKKEYLESLAYASYPIYKLVDVVNPDDVVYAPEKAIKGFPEVDIVNYRQLSLNVDIGYWDDPQKLTPMLQAIRERLHTYGVPPLNVQLFTAESAWMNEKEYEASKSIRMPGYEATVESDADVAKLVGKKIIANGSITEIVPDYSYFETTDESPVAGKAYYKRIIENNTVRFDARPAVNAFTTDEIYYERVANTVTLEKIKKQYGAVIDNRRFLTKLNPATDDIFISGQKYLVGLGNDKYKRLVENVDWRPGDVIPHYIPTSDTARVKGKTYYKKAADAYDALPIEMNAAAAAGILAQGVKVYTHEISYKQCYEQQSIDSDKVYFKGTSIDGVMEFESILGSDLQVLTPDIYELEKDEYVEVSTIPEGSTTQYFVKSTTSVEEDKSTDNPVGLFEKNDVYVLNYASESATDLIGMRFSYTDKMNSHIEKELTATDVIMIATERLPGIRINNHLVFNKFKGRWFEYVDETVSNGKTVKTRYAVVLNDTNWPTIQDKLGVIYGESGDLWRNIFIADDGLMNRNFYKLYMDECITTSLLRAKCDSLNKLLIAFAQNQHLDKYQQALEALHGVLTRIDRHDLHEDEDPLATLTETVRQIVDRLYPEINED